MHSRGALVRWLVLGGVVAAVVGLGYLLMRSDRDDAYAADVSAVCRTTYSDRRKFHFDYFKGLIFVSARKRDGLSRLAPPPSRLGVHRELERREARLAADAQIAIGHPAQVRTLRAEQAALDGVYRRLGIENCSE